jgi:hypothetical protein
MEDGFGIWIALWLLATPIAAAIMSLGGTSGARATNR